MRLPRSISTQHLGSVVAFLIAGSMVSFALGQQVGHATHVSQPATAHQSQIAGALGARIAAPAPQRPVTQQAPVAQTAPAASHTQSAAALIQTAPSTAHADAHHTDDHHGDGHHDDGGHGDKHGGGGSDGHSGGEGND